MVRVKRLHGRMYTKPIPKRPKPVVGPHEGLGAVDLCWCGEPSGHDWPGKAEGLPHPRT